MIDLRSVNIPGYVMDSQLSDLWVGVSQIRGRQIATGKSVIVTICKTSDTAHKNYVENEYQCLKKYNISRDGQYVLDYKCDGQWTYHIVSDIRGVSLSDYFRNPYQVNWKNAVYYTVQILWILGKYQADGKVLVDMSSDSFMLCENGDILLKRCGNSGASGAFRLTDQWISALGYCSPDVFKTRLTNTDSNNYSAASLFYELACGKKAYELVPGKKVPLRKSKIGQPRRFNADIPQDLEKIIIRAIDPNPANRYHSADEMLQDLVQFLKFHHISFVAHANGRIREAEVEAAKRRAASSSANAGIQAQKMPAEKFVPSDSTHHVQVDPEDKSVPQQRTAPAVKRSDERIQNQPVAEKEKETQQFSAEAMEQFSKDIRVELNALRAETRKELSALREEISALHQTIDALQQRNGELEENDAKLRSTCAGLKRLLYADKHFISFYQLDDTERRQLLGDV